MQSATRPTLTGRVTVTVYPNTAIRLVTAPDGRAAADWLEVGDGVIFWPAYATRDDEAVITAIDKFVDALEDLRDRAIRRLAAAAPIHEPACRPRSAFAHELEPLTESEERALWGDR